MIKNNLTTEKILPDFRDYFYTKGIEIVKPEAVNIIESSDTIELSIEAEIKA